MGTNVAELLVGAGLGLGVFVAQEAWPDLPPAVLVVLALIAAALFFAGLIGLVRQQRRVSRTEPSMKAGDGGPGGNIYPGGIGVAGGGGPGGGIYIDTDALIRGVLASGGTASTNAGQPLELNHLRSVAGKYADDHTNVHIVYYPPDKLPIARLIDSAFHSAGWPREFPEQPQPMGPYVEGTVVRGFLRHLVEEIAQALVAGHFPAVRAEVEQCEISPDNPKYNACLHSIYVTLGWDRRGS